MKLNIEIQNIKVKDINKLPLKPEELQSISQSYEAEKLAEIQGNEKNKKEYFQLIIKEGKIIIKVLEDAEKEYR